MFRTLACSQSSQNNQILKDAQRVGGFDINLKFEIHIYGMWYYCEALSRYYIAASSTGRNLNTESTEYWLGNLQSAHEGGETSFSESVYQPFIVYKYMPKGW